MGVSRRSIFDLPMDFDSLKNEAVGWVRGPCSDEQSDTCMVNIARFFTQFAQSESCGKCVLCREGTKQMRVLLDDIIEGKATEETLRLLEDVATSVQKGSLCGLGKTAPNPVLLNIAAIPGGIRGPHVRYKYCPTGTCKALTEVPNR